MLREARRLPGIHFEVQPPPLNDTLPRMDVAAFVGFAASGPLHLPVAIDDTAQFEAIFGRDLALVWDEKRGETVYAHLAPAVRAFFRNGGKRCYVIRVADRATAVSNRFPLPGIAQITLRDGAIRDIAPAFATARSPGSWSDSLRVSAGVLIRTVAVHEVTARPDGVELWVSDDVAPGDLLRITYRDAKLTVLIAVQTVKSDRPADASPPRPARTRNVLSTAILLHAVDSTLEAEAVIRTRAYHRNPDGEELAMRTGINVPAPDRVGITLSMAPIDAPPPGSLLRLETAHDTIWVTIDTVGDSEINLPPPAVYLEGQAVRWQLDQPAAVILPAGLPVAEALRLELRVSAGSRDALRLTDLEFSPGGARYWGNLPDDAAVYHPDAAARAPDPLWDAALRPRFPLAGDRTANAFAIPFFPTLEMLPRVLQTSELCGVQTDDPLQRDGLAHFDQDLFVHKKLVGSTVNDLMARANFIRFQSPNPTPLLDGMHGILSLEDVTLICVPDAVHTGWRVDCDALSEPEPVAEPVARPYRPEWHRFEDCDPPPDPAAAVPMALPPWDQFLDCRVAVIPAPVLSSTPADADGTLTLDWTRVPDAVYTLEESAEPDFGGAVALYEGDAERLTLYQRNPGRYYYHVRATVGINVSDWSNGVPVRVGKAHLYRLVQSDNATLLSIQRTLIRMCAARGDLFAVLTMPDNMREDQAIAHAEALRPASDNQHPPGASDDLPLSYGEAHALSYAALYHPWLIVREEQTQALRRTPLDGTVIGMIAQRSLSRGAWIAPANQRLSGIVALTPPLAAARRQDLLTAQVNIIRSEPYGFVALSADTLADDFDLLAIGTRRLLSLLRRLAQQHGAQYVFEPNDGVFQRMVQRGFDNLLDQMFVRGAFAGRTPETAYQVVVHNSPRDAEQGRLIVDLKVAPSLPLSFLTVRLIQSGERGIVINEVR